jgi:hypothetical protein
MTEETAKNGQMDQEAKCRRRIIAAISMLCAPLFITGGIARIVLCDQATEKLSSATLAYFAAAAGLLLLPWVKSITIGDTKIELLQSLEDKVKKIEGKSKDLEIRTTQVEGISKAAEEATRTTSTPGKTARGTSGTEKLDAVAQSIQEGSFDDDPWRGQFGGSAEAGGRTLTASADPIKGDPGWYLVHLVVKSAVQDNPLRGNVQFFIHPTFPNPKRLVLAVDGRAELHLKSYGAFTVGALADNGDTRLELNLAEDTSLPAPFRAR